MAGPHLPLPSHPGFFFFQKTLSFLIPFSPYPFLHMIIAKLSLSPRDPPSGPLSPAPVYPPFILGLFFPFSSTQDPELPSRIPVPLSPPPSPLSPLPFRRAFNDFIACISSLASPWNCLPLPAPTTCHPIYPFFGLFQTRPPQQSR